MSRLTYRLTLALVLAFAWLGFTDGARAQGQPSAGAFAAARELVMIKGGNVMFDPLVPGVIESAKNAFVPTNPQLIGQLNEVAAQLRKEYEPKRVEVTDLIAKAYAQRFTEQELKDLVAFYKSPVGKKMVAEEPRAIEESLAAARAWAAQFSDTVMDRFRSEMKKKGYNL